MCFSLLFPGWCIGTKSSHDGHARGTEPEVRTVTLPPDAQQAQLHDELASHKGGLTVIVPNLVGLLAEASNMDMKAFLGECARLWFSMALRVPIVDVTIFVLPGPDPVIKLRITAEASYERELATAGSNDSLKEMYKQKLIEAVPQKGNLSRILADDDVCMDANLVEIESIEPGSLVIWSSVKLTIFGVIGVMVFLAGCLGCFARTSTSTSPEDLPEDSPEQRLREFMNNRLNALSMGPRGDARMEFAPAPPAPSPSLCPCLSR